MKWLSTPLYYVLFVAFLLIISGCKKTNDNPSCRVPDCKVVKLKGNKSWSDTEKDSIIITYNSKGNPVSMKGTQTGTGYPEYIFRYDKYDRVTDLIGEYGNHLYFEIWYHYEYDNKNRIVLRHTYRFGTIGTGPLPERPTAPEDVSTYKYDGLNRIIETVDAKNFPDPYFTPRTNLYYYNTDGNMRAIVYIYDYRRDSVIITGYDDKVNMYQTHPIWLFLDRDYSKNNHFTAQAYNSYGLPTLYNEMHSYANFLMFAFNGGIEVTYKCR
jgi:hypothetical protein